MMPARWGDFGGILAIDFEFATTCGTGRPIPHTFCALDIVSGREIRLVGAGLRSIKKPPFDVRRCVVLAYYYHVAEASCFEVLGWPQPHWPVDLYIEHMAQLNGLSARDLFEDQEDNRRIRYRLIDALRSRGIEVSAEDEAHKRAMQLRSAEGEPFTNSERQAITNYCAEDVRWLARLFVAMRDEVDLPAALVRGRYTTAVAQQQHRGIPIDVELAERYQAQRRSLRQELIIETPSASQFYVGNQRFSQALFLGWTEEQGIGWPLTSHGSPDLERDTLKRITSLEPRIAPLAALRSKLAQLEAVNLPIRSDGRIRVNFRPFGTRTGRNAPHAREYPLLQAKWLRGLVCAPPGRALAQLDYQAQEVYIAGKLSEDRRLLEDLETDPYLGLAMRAGFAPAGATKKTHGSVREIFKIALLGSIYGMKEQSLAKRLGIDEMTAREVRGQLKRQYPALWGWLEDVVRAAYSTRYLETELGWPLHVGIQLDSRTLRNHLVQGNGADILRAACLFAQDAGLSTIATLHDSILLEAGADQIEAESVELAACMGRGAEHVIGIPIPVEVDFVGQRYRLKQPHAAFFEEVIRRIGAHSSMGGGK
jgi:DNA polymerase I-like protein with 3'-5' exonuclease and polymerase domains